MIADDQATFEKKVNEIKIVYRRIWILYLLLALSFVCIVYFDQVIIVYLTIIPLGILYIKAVLFKCPNCGKYFFYRILFLTWFKEMSSFWYKECVNCGFPRTL